MKNAELQSFADNYNPAIDFERIKFDWNGQHGDKFEDKNIDFRMQLCEFLIPQIENVKIELIKDLYTELAKCAEETWGVYNKFHLFAEQLLKRGKTRFLHEYMKGASLSMDTYLASGRIKISQGFAYEILNYMIEREKISSDKEELQMLEFFKERFEWHANNNTL
ncbi:MAG TPA: hypothetical protein VEC36_03200 [Patescibacteria group bacterium]|nr:hypothetical protein [Patescibacteria group bacterium]